ncbi:hypothetical protein Btru_038684 [Bulinus truncatus]|nr:hypothetical protein Btru_038684 [Bulinus truncatus]
MDLHQSSWRILSLFIILQFSIVRSQPKAQEYSRLRSEIMSRSVVRNKVPPNLSPNAWNETTLDIFLFVLDVLNVDQAEQVLNTIVSVFIWWNNTELRWTPEEYGGLDKIELDSSDLWGPRFFVGVGAKDSMYLTLPDKFILRYDGSVLSKSFHYLSFRCHFDLTRYPFDVQQCGFELFPMNEPSPNLILLKLIFNNTGIYDLFGEWVVIDHSPEIVVPTWQNLFPKITFVLKRKPAYYVIFLVFPMVLTSMLTPLVFLIPARVGEKMSYLVAIFTSNAIFITLISDALPRTLASAPYLAMLLIEVMVEGVCAILASLLVVNTFEREETMNTSGSANSDVQANGIKFKSDNCKRIVEELTTGKSSFPSRMTSKHMDRLFLALFGLCQLIFLIILFCLTDWLVDL